MRRTKPLSTTQYDRFTEYNRREDIRKLANIEAQKFCQIENEDFTPTPPIPTQSIVVEKIPLNVGIWNFIRQLTP